MLEGSCDRNITLNGDGAQRLDACRDAKHVHGRPQVANRFAQQPLPANHHAGAQGLDHTAHDEIRKGHGDDEDVGGCVELRGASNSQDDQQVPHHREEDDQHQRKNKQGFWEHGNQAGVVGVHPERKLSVKKRNGQFQSQNAKKKKKSVVLCVLS